MTPRTASVLVVEDEALIRLMLVDMLEGELGHRVVAETGSVPEGQSLAENIEFDLAILDVNLDGKNVLPVAQAIENRGVPFLFVSGYKRADLPAPFRDRLLVEKPIELTKLKPRLARFWAAKVPAEPRFRSQRLWCSSRCSACSTTAERVLAPGGHGTVAYEQNTQQSPDFGLAVLNPRYVGFWFGLR